MMLALTCAVIFYAAKPVSVLAEACTECPNQRCADSFSMWCQHTACSLPQQYRRNFGASAYLCCWQCARVTGVLLVGATFLVVMAAARYGSVT